CFIIETPSGIVGRGKSSDKLLATQRLPFESRADADPSVESFNFGGIVGRKPHDRVGLRIADPDAVLRVDSYGKRRFQPADLHKALVPDAPTGEVQQLVLGRIRDPHVAIRRNTDALQSANLASKRKVAFLRNRPTVEVHDAD